MDAVNMHIDTSLWLEKEALKLTEEWYELERRFRELAEKDMEPAYDDIMYAEKIERKMIELENRIVMEEKIYNQILKKID